MKRATIRLIAAAAATLLLGVAALAGGLSYADAGEALIMKAFSGFQGGAAVSFHPQLQTALGWLMYALASIAPGVPWMSVALLASFWLSFEAIIRGAAMCARSNGLPAWAGALAGAVCAASLGLGAMWSVSLASAAALCGAAAIASFFGVDYAASDDRRVLRGSLASVVYLLLCVCLDPRMGAISFAMWCLAALGVRLGDYSHREVARLGTQARHGARGLAIGVLVGAFCVASLVAVRAVEISAMSEQTAWRQAYERLESRGAFTGAVSDEALERAGWTRERLDAAASGFLYGSDMSADSMNALADELAAPQEPTLHETATGLLSDRSALLRAIGCFALALVALALPSGARARLGSRLVPFVALLAGFAACLWLARSGDAAAARLSLAPCSTALLGMALRALRPEDEPTKPVEPTEAAEPVKSDEPDAATDISKPLKSPVTARKRNALAARLAAAALASAWLAASALSACADLARAVPQGEGEAFEEALYEYALEKSDKLFFYSPRLAGDTRMFPDMSRAPQNVMLPDPLLARSDATLAQLASFGLDGWRLKTSALLEPFVLFASTDKGPWQRLLPYLRQSASGDRYWASYEARGELSLYRLCER